ncbi:MAG: hypothetical protein IPM69_01740 [Ignavibacteria bacterium]|nr:hypothetical protein [Ignavibacteria bacterium]
MKTTTLYLLSAVMIVAMTFTTNARTKDQTKGKNQPGESTLRTASNTFDLQKNKVSRIEFYNTNYGIIGHDTRNSLGGGIWPRGSQNQYIYAGGVWFCGTKTLANGKPSRLCEISYNPNSGASWFAPGSIEDGDLSMDEYRTKYRVYFSTDFRPDNGAPFNSNDGPNWPIWDNSEIPNDTLKKDRYVGNYVDDISLRNRTFNPKGPAFISGEDIFSIFKDTDLNRYEGGVGTRRSQGFPMRLQYEQTIFSWGFGDYRDFIFVKYAIINKSVDTIKDCWVAAAYDMDIAQATNGQNGAANDRCKFYSDEDSLNLAVQWSLGTQGERGKGFGYIGFDFLESPAIDATGRIRHDKKYYDQQEQLGLVTFRNWSINEDLKDNGDRYDFVSQKQKDGDTEAGDKRFLMSTGPFTMVPKDTVRVVVGIVFANTSKGGDADGTVEDLVETIRKDKFAQKVYDDNFRAPIPPDASEISWRPLNNAILVTWDSTSEMSFDRLEEGLDFLGYKLYRARRDDLDSFDVNVLKSPINRGPLGWKQIAQWEMLTPFLKSFVQVGDGDVNMPFLDSLRIVQQVDSFKFIVRRFPSRASQNTPFGVAQWKKYYSEMPFANLQKLLTGEININRALVTTPPKWKNLNAIPWIADPSGMEVPWKQNSAQGFSVADSISYENLMSGLLALLRQGKAVLNFVDIEIDSVEREKIRRQVIVPYMDSITNNSSFVDLGDDDRNGEINEDPDPTITEKLLNNVDYFYRLQAYDEGDYKQLSPKKENVGISELNQLKVSPYAAAAGAKEARVVVTMSDSSTLGGLYNFRFHVLNQDRLNQLFTNADNGGHEIEIEFLPAISPVNYPPASQANPQPPIYGLYQRRIVMRDKSTGKSLFDGTTFLEPTLCNTSVLNLFTENAATYIFSDTVITDSISGKINSFGVFNDRGSILRNGTFTTNKTGTSSTCYSGLLDNEARLTLGFSFDYGILQQGGIIRPDTAFALINSSGAETPLQKGDIQRMQRVDTVFNENGGSFVYGSFNNGPADYEVEFTEGGDTTLTLAYGTKSPRDTKQVKVKYLNTKVTNKISYKRIDENGDSVVVAYPNEVPSYTNPLTVFSSYPLVTDVPVGQYNLSSYAWVSARGRNNLTSRRAQSSGLSGQGRYYLSVVDDIDTVDFIHVFQASGAEFGIDYGNKARRFSNDSPMWDTVVNYVWNKDFQKGDKIAFRVVGGALGLPLPGAKIAAKVITSVPNVADYTDEMLDQVKIVPNPYYVTEQSQRSPYDAKIRFTKLPKQCTIKIYTITGELLRTIEHNETTSPEPDKYAMEPWDLLTTNRQRAASQTLVAEISTPNGAKSIQKFSLIVGGFRLISE